MQLLNLSCSTPRPGATPDIHRLQSECAVHDHPHHHCQDHVELGGGPEKKTVLLQIDGLGYNVLKQAMDKGLAPNLKRALQQQAYILKPFLCGIPAETVPVLSSLFYGVQIPANDWWSKEKQAMVDSSNVEREVQQKALKEHGEPGFMAGGKTLLAPFSGGSEDTTLAVSHLHEDTAAQGKWKTIAQETWKCLKLVVKGDGSVTRLAYRTLKDIIDTRRDLKQSGQWNTWWDQHYPYMLSLSKNIFPVVATEGVKQAIDQGLRTAYVDFTDYDEAGHYYGCKSERALEAVQNIDGRIGEILDKVHHEGHPYEVIVFSDHGQTPSTPFRKAFGTNLEELIDDHIRKLRPGQAVAAEEVVCAHAYSMNNVYFNFDKKTVGEAEIEARYPGLIDSLTRHPGIGLVVARRSDGLILKGPEGSLTVKDGRVEQQGKNPLEMYGHSETILKQLQTYAGVHESGDLMVFAVYEKDKDHTYDFGEKYTMKALHGGLGGDQGMPFMMYRPSAGIDPQDTIAAIQLHEKVAHQRCRM